MFSFNIFRLGGLDACLSAASSGKYSKKPNNRWFKDITKSGVLHRRPLSTTIKRIHTRIYLQISNRFIHKHYMAYNLNPMLQSYCPAKFSTIAKYG